MSITIVKAGIYDTIQDAGRFGYAGDGINPSGVMDLLAMKTANVLAGNTLETAVIEMHFPASVIRFEADAIVAIAGADFGATITANDGKQISFTTNKAAYIKAGSTVSFEKKIAGERGYLSVHGGFGLTEWLGSFSTNIKISEGGFKGRRLQQNDCILLNKKLPDKFASDRVFPWIANTRAWYQGNLVNVLAAPEWEWLQPLSKKAFLSKPFTILSQSDRMGMRLQGPSLQRLVQDELVSAGVVFGTIQLLPNGNIIVLMADHAITGGYPRVANIISAHLPKLAQLSPGSQILLARTDIAKAEELLIAQEREIRVIQTAVAMRFNEFNLG